MSANQWGITPRPPADRFANWNRANECARAEYQRVKADHALPFGCDVCTRGTNVADGGHGWRSVVGLLFCPRCKTLELARRLIAQTIAARSSVCESA